MKLRKRIAYLHGLESKSPSQKSDWLHENFAAYTPSIDYSQSLIYSKIQDEVVQFKPDLLVGSSMGGYFASNLSSSLNVPVLLFNPALHSRSMQPDMTGLMEGNHSPPQTVVLGLKDQVINPHQTIELLPSDATVHMSDHGHRTSFDLFRYYCLSLLSPLDLH